MISHSQMGLLQQMQTLETAASGKLANPNIGLNAEIESNSTQGFGELMQKAIRQVNETQMDSAELSRAFEMGDKNVDLSEVMIAIQKSRVSFTALTEVRNKLLTAYQDVMNMPV